MTPVYVWPSLSEERFTEIELDLVHAGYTQKQLIEVRPGVELWRCK